LASRTHSSQPPASSEDLISLASMSTSGQCIQEHTQVISTHTIKNKLKTFKPAEKKSTILNILSRIYGQEPGTSGVENRSVPTGHPYLMNTTVKSSEDTRGTNGQCLHLLGTAIKALHALLIQMLQHIAFFIIIKFRSLKQEEH